MNFADIQNAWASPHNRQSPAEIEAHKNTLATALARRRRGFLAFIVPPLVALIAFTALFAWRVTGGDLVVYGPDMAVPLLLVLPWAAIIYFLRRHGAHLSRHPDYRSSLVAALRALLDDNRQARARVKTMILMHLVSMPLLAFAVRQLADAGKVRAHELRSMIVFFGTVIVVALVGLLLFHLRKLRPEQDRLQALLRSYEE
jgi:hypothetical protein